MGRVKSVSMHCDESTDSKVTLLVTFVDNNWWSIDFTKDRIAVYDHANGTSTGVNLS